MQGQATADGILLGSTAPARALASQERDLAGVQTIPQTLHQALKSRTATEWLLTAAYLAAGGFMFREGVPAGIFGSIFGVLLAAEVMRRRASWAFGLSAIVFLGLCRAFSTEA